jgi:hypothetical protein
VSSRPCTLVADVAESAYIGAVTRLVMEPLGLANASIPTQDTDLGPEVVTGYQVTGDGILQPAR